MTTREFSVITSEAKQSMEPQAKMDCFVASAFARRATADKSLLAMTVKSGLIYPTGKSVVIFLSSPICKNISLNPSGKSLLQLPPSCPKRGALRNVINAGRDAVDAGGALTNALSRTAKSCGPDASTPASSLRGHLRR
jgi:hypothetical protein